MVMAWSVDRLGRSLQDLVGFLSAVGMKKAATASEQRFRGA
jgi:hypothetical protein